MVAPTKLGVKWQAIRRRWKDGETSYSIAKGLRPDGPSRQAIDQYAKRANWSRISNDEGATYLPCARQYPGLIDKTLANPERLGLILQLYKEGMSQNQVAALAGIATGTTLNKWRQDDEDFNRDVLQAQGEYTKQLIGHINDKAEVDWRASSYLLERHPLTRDDMKATDESGKTITVRINIDRSPMPEIAGEVIENDPDLTLEEN